MTLPTQTFAQFVEAMTSSLAASTGVTPVFTAGDPFLASFESLSIQLQYLQSLAEQLVALTRAQTSTGGDLDTWMAQFGFSRLPATFASADLTLSALYPVASRVLIPAGTIVQTTPGSVQFEAVADTTQTTWNAGLNAYVLAAGQTSLTATFQAVVAGSGSNTAAGSSWLISSPLVGISTVTNTAAITNGIDAESDSAFRARFINFISSLAEGTRAAILAAISSVQQGLLVTLAEYQNPSGQTIVGGFTAFIDDGSGSPPSTLISSVTAAVNGVRAFGIRAYVAAANVVNLPVVITIRLEAGANETTVAAAVQVAINAVALLLPAGATLFVSAIVGAALGVSGVAAVQPGTTINGVAADYVPGATTEPRVPTTDVTVSTY